MTRADLDKLEAAEQMVTKSRGGRGIVEFDEERRLKRCAVCARWLPPEGFTPDKRCRWGAGSPCRDCRSIATRERARARSDNDESFRQRVAAASRRYAARHGHRRPQLDITKQRAREKFRWAIRSGKIVRPTKCQGCGAQCCPHGHHTDYAKPLDVVWLCRRCHGLAHRVAYDAATGAGGEEKP